MLSPYLLEGTNKTMTDVQIDKIMKKLISAYEEKTGAHIR